MGVKKSLDPDLEEELGSINRTAPRYSLWSKLKLILSLMHKSKKCILSTKKKCYSTYVYSSAAATFALYFY